MANPQTPHIKDSEQAILNKSFDPDFNVLATQGLQFNGTALKREPTPLVDEAFDYIGITYPTTTTEVYVFKQGGSGGTTMRTLTLTYVDDTKAQLSSVARS